jgi:hypothetical protein
MIVPCLGIRTIIGLKGHKRLLEEVALWNEFPMLGEWVNIFIKGVIGKNDSYESVGMKRHADSRAIFFLTKLQFATKNSS